MGKEVLALVVVACGLLVVGTAWWRASERRRLDLDSFRNLQQWGIALNLCLMDQQHRLPEIGPREPDPEAMRAWYNLLPPYLAQPRLSDLAPERRPRPGERTLWGDSLSRITEAPTNGKAWFGYAMNRYLHPTPRSPALRIHDLEDPGRTVFLAEVSGTDPGALPAQVVFRRGPKSPSPDARAYVLYCDGHAALVTKGRLVDDPAVIDPDSPAADGPRWIPHRNALEPDPYLAE